MVIPEEIEPLWLSHSIVEKTAQDKAIVKSSKNLSLNLLKINANNLHLHIHTLLLLHHQLYYFLLRLYYFLLFH